MSHYTTFGLTFAQCRNNGTVMDSTTALTTTWVGGSITPLAGLNSGACVVPQLIPLLISTGYIGFSMYEVDPVTFE